MKIHNLRPAGIITTAASAVTMIASAVTLVNGILVIINGKSKNNPYRFGHSLWSIFWLGLTCSARLAII